MPNNIHQQFDNGTYIHYQRNMFSSLGESALVYVNHLRSYFSLSQPKRLRSRARGYLSELHWAACPEGSHSPFCFPFTFNEFLETEAICCSTREKAAYQENGKIACYIFHKKAPRNTTIAPETHRRGND